MFSHARILWRSSGPPTTRGYHGRFPGDPTPAKPDAPEPWLRGPRHAGPPGTVRGLLFHAAEHAQRHAGAVIATAKVVRGLVVACLLSLAAAVASAQAPV